MSRETFLAYWSGEEPTGPDASPTLAQSPDGIDVIILFYVLINDDGSLNFDRLTLHNDQAQIMAWMAEIRQRQAGSDRPTRFTLGILSDSFSQQDPASFASAVAAAAADWGVDGITIDYEPPTSDKGILDVVSAIRAALPKGALMTAPIYLAWNWTGILGEYMALFDMVTTMDYTPYPGYDATISAYEGYVQANGGNSTNVAIGVSCMVFTDQRHTPLDDVKKLCDWEPTGSNKLGIMLYTLSYDAPGHGSPYPLFTYTNTILKVLP